MARLLSPQEFGVYALGAAIVGVASIVASNGIGAYMIREPDLSVRQIESAFFVNSLVNVLLACSLLAFSFLPIGLMHQGGVRTVVRLLALIPLVQTLEFRPWTLALRAMSFRQTSLVSSCANVGGTGVMIVFAYAGWSFLSITFGSLTSALIRVVAINLLYRTTFSIKMSFLHALEVAKFGTQMLTITGFSQLSQRLSELFLGDFLGLSALGIYNRAYSIYGIVQNNLLYSINTVLFSKMSEQSGDIEEVNLLFLKSFKMVISILWPLTLGISILARPLVYILFGAKWLPASGPLAVLMVAQFVVISFGLNWELFVVHRRTAEMTKLEVMRSCSGAVFFAIGSVFNVEAATLGRVAEALLAAILYVPRMAAMSRQSSDNLSSIYMEGLLCTFSAVLPSLCLMILMRWDPLTPIWAIAAAVALGGLVWLLVLRHLQSPLFSEFLRISHQVRSQACFRVAWRS